MAAAETALEAVEAPEADEDPSTTEREKIVTVIMPCSKM